MKISAATLAVALILGGTSMVLPADSAQAQALDSLRQRQSRRPPAGQCRLDPPPGQPAFEISTEECVAIAGVLQPIQTQDWAAAQAALPAAQSAARSPDARYQVAQAMLHIGIGTSNTQLQAQAVDAMIESGRPQGEELSRLLRHQIEFATTAGNTAKAEQARARLLQLSPNDPNTIVQLANSQSQTDPAGAIRLYQQAIQAQTTAGQPVPEAWRAQILRLAYARRMPESVTYARELVAASPTPAYWHDALVIYRDLNSVGEPLFLDYYRLMRATRSLASERDYIEYADAAQSGAVFGEVKSVLEEGLSRNVLNSSAAYARETLTAATRRIAEDQASLATERGVELRFAPDARLGPTGDPDLGRDLVTVLGNLVDNALDAAPGGWVEIGLSSREGAVRVRVRDSGPGVASELAEEVFRHGFTTKAAESPGGRGLGLALVREVCLRRGGSVAVEGSTFTAVLG